MGSGKSGGKGSSLKDYYASFAGVLGWGPAFALVARIVDGKEVWRPGSPVLRSASANPYVADITGYGRTHFYWGLGNQTLSDPVLTATGRDQPNYRHRIVDVYQDFLCGRERESVPNIEVIYWRKPQQTLITGVAADLDSQGQCNPLCAIVERITDPIRGLGKADSFFNATAWQNLADELYADRSNQYLSLDLMEAGSVRDLVEEINGYLDTFFRADDAGLLEVGQFLSGAAFPTGLDTLTEDDLEKGSSIDVVPKPLVFNSSSLELKYIDRYRKFEENSASYSSQHMEDLVQDEEPAQLERQYIRRGPQANKKAAEIGSKEIRAIDSISGKFRPEKTIGLRPGDLVTLNKASTNFSQIARILKKEADGDDAGATSLVLETERMLAPPPGDFDEEELPAESPYPLEDINYWHVLQAPELLSGVPFALFALVGQDHGTWHGSQVWFQDQASEYLYLGDQNSFAVPALLAAAYAASEALDDETGNLLIELPDPAALGFAYLETAPTEDQISNDEYLLILIDPADSELFEICTLKLIDTPTAGEYPIHVLRARFGTTRLSFSAGDPCYFVSRKSLQFFEHRNLAAIAARPTEPEQTVNIKVIPWRTDEYFELSSATLKQLEIDSGLPDTPTNFSITPGPDSIFVKWTNTTDFDLSVVQILADTDPAFGAYPLFHTKAAKPGLEGTFTIRLFNDASGLRSLYPGVKLYVKIRSVNLKNDFSPYSSALYTTVKDTQATVPDFSEYGQVAGITDFTYKLNYDHTDTYDLGSVKLNGNRLINPETEAIYALPYPYSIKVYYGGVGDGTNLPFYLVYLGEDVNDTIWQAGVFPNPANHIVPVFYAWWPSQEKWVFVMIDTLGIAEVLPTGQDYLLFAKGEMASNNRIVYCNPLTAPVTKPLEIELEFPDITAMKAFDFTPVPDAAPVRVKNRRKMYYDPASTDTPDDIVIFQPTTGPGRVKYEYEGDVMNILEAGASTAAAFDNTAAINAALALANRVFIPEGTFEYSGKIDISDEHTVYGVSHGASILKANHADAHVSFASNSRVSNLRIDGDDIAQFGLIAAFGSGAMVEHVRILNHTEAGLCLDGTQNSSFINLKIHNNKRNIVLANDARNNWFFGIQTRFFGATIPSHADNRHIWAGVWTHAKLATPPYGGQTLIRNMFLGGVFEGEHGNDYALEFYDGGLAGHGMSFYQTEITSYPDATACVKVGTDFGATIDFNNCKFENAYAFDLDAGSHVRAFHCYYTGGGAEGKHLGTGRLDLGVDQLDVGFNALSKRDAINNSIFHYGIGDWVSSGTATVAHNATTKVMDVTSPSTTGNSGTKVQPARFPTMIAAYTGRVVEIKAWIENNLAQRAITALTAGTDRITLDTTDWNVIADFSVGDEVIYIAGDSDIGGLTNGQTYYVSARSATEMGLENAPGSGDIDLTGTLPTGTHYIRHVNPPIVLRWITFDGSFSTRQLGTMIDGMNTFWDRLQGDEVGIDMISQKLAGQSWSVGMVKTLIH